MMSQFTFNRPLLRIDTGGGDADLSRYADHVLSICIAQARPHDAMELTSLSRKLYHFKNAGGFKLAAICLGFAKVSVGPTRRYSFECSS